MYPSSSHKVSNSTRRAFRRRTSNLLFKPLKSSSRQLLIRGSVCERVGYGHILEVLENGALHSQLVQVRIEEGDDPFREGRGAVKIHAEVPEAVNLLCNVGRVNWKRPSVGLKVTRPETRSWQVGLIGDGASFVTVAGAAEGSLANVVSGFSRPRMAARLRRGVCFSRVRPRVRQFLKF